MTGPLISPGELGGVLDEATVLDVRYRTGGAAGHEEFVRGHVPGARYVDLDADLADPPGGDGGRHPLPDPGRFAEAMRRVGVCDARPVVVYDDWAGRAAARAWWLLRHHGHGDVRVLDGGWTAWLEAGGPVEVGAVEVGAVEVGEGEAGEGEAGTGDFTAAGTAQTRTRVVGPDEVPAVGVLVDARAPERYRGEQEPLDPVAGHIPGAVNVPTTANVDERGRFRPPEELRTLYARVGATPQTDVAAYCGSGVTACHDILAMEVAGIPAALYPGSWSGWVSDPERPVTRGGTTAPATR